MIPGQLSRELRRSVLRPHYAVDALLPGDGLSEAVHLGASRWSARTGFWQCVPDLSRTVPLAAGRDRLAAALDGHRSGLARHGAGRQILRAAKQISAEAGATVLWCQAREPAIPFYRRNGFAEFGELFDTELGPHRRMWIELTD